MIEIRSSFSRSFQLFVIVMLFAALTGAATVLSWQNLEASGILLAAVLGALFVLLVITYRMLSRPVMFRLDGEGIYIKRLGITIPWEALDRVESFDYQGNRLFSLIEAEQGHEIFQHKRILTGAAINQQLGLPALVISMSGMQMTDEEFSDLLSNSEEVVRFIDVSPQ